MSEPSASTLAAFVASSTSADNATILTLIRQSDLGDSVAIVEALGRRSDPAVGEIIDGLSAPLVGKPHYVNELLLRLLLSAVCFRQVDRERATFPTVQLERARANGNSLNRLVQKLQGMDDAELKALLLLLAPTAAPGSLAQVLADEGDFLTAYLRSRKGRAEADRMDEALAYLEVVGHRQDPVLREQVLSIVELSRDARLVAAARRVLHP